MLNVFFQLFSIPNASSLFNTQLLFSIFLYKWGLFSLPLCLVKLNDVLANFLIWFILDMVWYDS
jgi:hypothetical protein